MGSIGRLGRFRNPVIAIGMAMFAGLAVSCSDRGDEPVAAPTSSETTGEEVLAPSPDPFEYLRFASNTDSVAPEICLTFSHPLDPAVDYSAYVDVEGQVSASVAGSRLCLGGIAYGEERSVTLRKGLPDAEGNGLESDESLTVTFEDRPPVVAFSGNGIILPRVEADGLAITTVNVSEVEISVTRVNDRALVTRAITEGFEVGPDDYWYEYGDDTPGEYGTEIWSGTMSTEGPTNGTVTTVFPFAEVVGDIEPGAYYVRVSDATPARENDRRVARTARWIISTDLALTTYRGANGADVTVRSLQTATPVGGTTVQLIARSNEVLKEVRTPANGMVHFDAPILNGEGGDRPRLIMAFGVDGDFAMLDLDRAPVDLSSQPISGRFAPGAVDGFVWLDRGIYRPGETVQASLMLRDPTGRAISDRPGALVLYKPNGIEFDRVRFDKLPDAGGLSHPFDLPISAIRGSWYLATEIDGIGTIRTTYFSVEDFVPQRIEIDLAGDGEAPLVSADPRMIDVEARFLYGAPGAGLTVDGTARIQRDPSPFEGWEGYSFGLSDEDFSEVLLELPAVVTDGAGKAAIPVSAGRRAAASTLPLRLRAVVEVEEPGGRTVADDIFIPYRPRPVYYGIKSQIDGNAERNKPAAFDVVAVDRVGAAQSAKITWRLVRRDFDYDWYRVDGGQWKWRRSERIVPIEEGVLGLDGETAGGIETAALPWGDYRLILNADGEDVASASFWVGWGGYSEDGEEAPDEVRVSLVNDAVKVGDTARIAIRAPYAGKADVVAASSDVIRIRQIDVPEGGTEVSLPVTEAWGAGAYVLVTVHTPRDKTLQPRPRRAVGVVHVPVDAASRTFEVGLGLDEKVDPGQTLKVPVTVSGGPRNQKIFMTIAAVDEGILQLTNFQSPDPAEWFFGRRYLGVSLYDDYGRLLDPNQGLAAPVRSGGDQIGGAGLTVVPTKTVALFQGPVDLGRDGKGSVELDLPDFNGKLRVMMVAWSETGVGASAQGLVVRDAVPAELILPRFLSPGDSALATLTVDNVEGQSGDYAVAFAATGPLAFAEKAKTVTLEQGERTDDAIAIEATDVGIAESEIRVTGPGGFTASSTYPIEVRSAHWPETRIERRTLAPGEAYTPAMALVEGFVPHSADVRVSVSATPIDATALFASLYSYPYACTEQLTSRMIPMLYSANLSKLAAGEGPDGAPAQIRRAIETLLSRQSADGSFGLWRMGDQEASPWLGAYAADFLSRAAAAGYSIPEAALSRAFDALDPVADGQMGRAWGYDTSPPNPRWSDDTGTRLSHRSAAYALYVLARNGRGDRSRLRYMHDELREEIESPLAMAHIGAGLAAMGDLTRARSSFAAAIDKLGYVNRGDWYQSPRRDLAGVLGLAAEAGLNDVVETLIPKVQEGLPEPARLTTQEKAFLILAADAISGGAEAVPVAYTGKADDPASVSFDQESLADAGTFTNQGDHPVYVTALAKGAPSVAPAAQSSGIEVTKGLTDLKGRPVDISDLAQGQRLVVALTVRPKRRALAPYMLVDLLPAGLEIEAIIRPDEAGDEGAFPFLGELSRAKLSEARDDRYVSAFDGSSSSVYKFAYIARTVTAGEFTLPGAVVEDMYKPDVFARTRAGDMTITP
ncbi:MAG: alpha-2-macroglobulin family protein [Parvularcula sp.]